MQWRCHQTDYRDTGYFPQIILDYIHQKDELLPYISTFPSIEGIREKIAERKKTKTNRSLLVAHLQHQYQQLAVSEKVQHSIQKLAQENTYTITTAHQPNLLTGPLYFIYKIVHTIRLADYCNQHISDCHFVPVYYMGMEDADFMELNHFTVRGKKYVWDTQQTGAFGRMKVDRALIQLLDQLESQMADLPHAQVLIKQLRHCYSEGKTIAAATFEWVHALFESFGLVVFIPDSKAVKSVLAGVMEDDLLNHSAHSILEGVKSGYPYPHAWQANARPINLFYLKDYLRERIEADKGKYQVLNTSISFTQAELLQELQQHPDRFSPNVIIRPLLQESILPNLVYIGGAGELSYWLQLKKIFDHYQISFPALMLRSSFVLMDERQKLQWEKLGFNESDIFSNTDKLSKMYVQRHSEKNLSLEKEQKQLTQIFNEIADKAADADITLKAHVAALLKQSEKKMIALEKKILRAEKRRFTDAVRQINTLSASLFPDQTLQERREGMIWYYAMWGKEWIDQLLNHTPVPDQKMTVLTYPLSN